MAKKQPSLAELIRSEYGTREPKYSVKKAVPNTPVKGKRDFSVRVSDGPSASEIGKSVLGVVKNAPAGIVPTAQMLGQGLLDLGKFSAKNAYLGLKDRFTGGDEQMQNFAATDFAKSLAANPGRVVAENAPVIGGALSVSDLMGNAIAARRAGDEATASRLEGLVVPMLAAGLVPGGKAVAKGERGVLRGEARALTRPHNPLQVVSQEYSPAIARRLDGMIDADAPLSEWRGAAERLKNADLAVNNMQRAPSRYSVRPAEIATDPRIESRKGELGKIANLELHVAPRVTDPQPPVSIFDKEGHGYVMSMSDLSAAGDDLLGINDVMFRQPFSRKGGQGYMFDNPGEVWAADKKAAEEHVELADQLQRETGKPTLLLPWTMGPRSIDFSHQPRGAQYMYADAAMDAADRNKLAADIKTILPNWRGFEDPEGVQMFMGAAGKARGALNKLLDQYRDRGGLGLGAARYATTDLSQIGVPLTTLRNVGVIDPRFGAAPSSHFSYSYSVPGQGEGVLAEPNIGALALAPDIMEALGYKTPFDFPVGVKPGTKSPMRSMQLKPKGGVLDYKTLRYLDDLLSGSGG